MRTCTLGVRITSSAFAAALGFFASSTRGEDSGKELPPALVVVAGAQKVAGRSIPGDPERVAVSYELETAFPAGAVVDEIRTKLERSGWKPLSRESISAINPSALRTGWRNHVNAASPSQAPTQSFVWDAQWSDRDGDVVSFTLMYLSTTVSPEGQAPKPDNDTLRVNGMLKVKYLVPLEGLPPSLIVLDGAKDVGAWRSSGEQRVGYDLTSGRPPSEAMATLSERLEKQGWKPVAEPPPTSWVKDDWAKTHEPGWSFGGSGGYRGHLEWRSMWRNEAGSTVRYALTYAGVLPAGIKEDPAHGVTDYYVEAGFNPTGQGRLIIVPPSGTPSVRVPSPR